MDETSSREAKEAGDNEAWTKLPVYETPTGRFLLSMFVGLVFAHLKYPLPEWFSPRDTQASNATQPSALRDCLANLDLGMTQDEVDQAFERTLPSVRENHDYKSQRLGGAFAGQTVNCWYRIGYAERPWDHKIIRSSYFYDGPDRYLPGQECIVLTYGYTHTNPTYELNRILSHAGSTTPRVDEIRYFSGKVTRWPRDQRAALFLGLLSMIIAYICCRKLAAGGAKHQTDE